MLLSNLDIIHEQESVIECNSQVSPEKNKGFNTQILSLEQSIDKPNLEESGLDEVDISKTEIL